MISISIIIPIYNEEQTLQELLNRVNEIKETCELEIILINDGSKDNSKKIIETNSNLYNKFINLPKNKGKGKAIIEGLNVATKEYIFFQDADLEYSSVDLKKFIKLIEDYKADFIMGSRFISESRSVLNFWHKAGNQFITLLYNLLNNTTFTDIYCCHCLFRRTNLNYNELKIFGWGQQAEILTYLSRSSSKIFETAVNYDARKYGEGKKIRFYHVFEVIYVLLFTRIKLFFYKK